MDKNSPENDRAQRLMAMGQMAASLAHEIRNPLGSMELFCTLLKKDLAGQPESLGLAEQIHSGIRTLDRIISNCLQFSRDIVPKKREVSNVGALLDEALKYVEGKANALGVNIERQYLGEGSIAVDAYLLNQVLLNLLMNAVDAASDPSITDGRSRFVSVRSEISMACGWTISIEDNGVGIPQEDLEKIYDPFFTTKSGGTGLGLSIVLSIVNSHGGTIRFESAVQQGTKVVLHFSSQEEGTGSCKKNCKFS